MLTVRFSETQGYDINLDVEVVQFVATTGTGSYFSTVPYDRTLAVKRRQFQERVKELMQEGQEPGEISFETGDEGI